MTDKSGTPNYEELEHTLRSFATAYPERVFTPLTDEEIETYSNIVTRNSAAMGRHMSQFTTQAADAIAALSNQLTKALSDLAESNKLVNIYRGAATMAVDCEKHADVIATCCPICLREELESERLCHAVCGAIAYGAPADGISDKYLTDSVRAVIKLQEELAESRAEVERLLEYVAHHEHCALIRTTLPTARCTCGLKLALLK